MTDNELRQVFAGFQNLNLVATLVDANNGTLAYDWWVNDYYEICPIAHGWRNGAMSDDGPETDDDCIVAAGVCLELGRKFTEWWDAYQDYDTLVRVLESIYQERLEDADCVQEVIQPTTRRVNETVHS